MRTIFVSLVPLAAASPAFAHPGHGAGGAATGVLHYLTEPEHLFGGALVLAIVGAVAIVRRMRRDSRLP